MRRKERELHTKEEMQEILRACKVCRLAMNGPNGTPYLVPLNFGYEWGGPWPTLYMHCALEGHKLDLLRRDCRVCFEMDCGHELTGEESACSYSYRYASVIGTGDCEIVMNDAEKEIGLQRLMEHQTGRTFDGFSLRWFDQTAVLRVRVEQMTAKANRS